MMKPSKIVGALIVLLFLSPRSALFCQQSSLPTSKLADLRSSDARRRSAAYEELKVDPATLRRPDVKTELVDLLDRENRYLHGAKRDLGEGFAEYISELGDTVVQFVDWNDPHQACVLAQSPYDPESQFADELAIKSGAVVVPCLLNMSRGNSYDQKDSGEKLVSERQQAIPVLVHIAAVTNGLSSSFAQQIRQATIGGLSDPSVLVRESTIEAVGRFGTQEMIPILQSIARSDPVSRRLDNGQLRFGVRDAAMKAIESIQDRANTK
jgi:hypothetical protein